ncbi:MAG: hypothetical protein AAGI01_07370, partial [Myxococcota bacterium]
MPRTSSLAVRREASMMSTRYGFVLGAPILAAGLLAPGCSARASSVAPEDLGPTPLELASQAQVEEARPMLTELADRAAAYFTSEQRFDAANGLEPWHVATIGSDTRDVGMLVDDASRVFPGGSSVSFATHAEAPRGGTPAAPSPVCDVRLETMLRHFEVDPDKALKFRYTFRATGSGSQATAQILAEGDFDPDTEGAHTVTVDLSVDAATGEVRVGELVV